jgi:glycosyltransferase involved in cell wall biosynthesis
VVSANDDQTAAAIRPRRAPAVRVRFLTPNLIVGGVEFWLLSLLRYGDSRLNWNVVVTNPGMVEPRMRREIERFAPVKLGSTVGTDSSAASDVLVAWGIRDLEPHIRGFRGPIVMVSHGCGAWTESWLTAARSHATHFAAVSEAAAVACGEPGVAIIPNGIDVDRCLAIRPRHEVRNAWGLRPDEIAVGYVGRFSSEKNPLATAEAVRALGRGHRAVYIGRGWPNDDLIPFVRAIASDAVFVPPMHQIGDALSALDCLIAASPSEGFGLAPVEAMHCQLPVVATPVGILPEMHRQHGRVCVTVPIHPTPDQLATAVCEALSPAHRPVVEHAARIIRTHFSAAASARRWVDFLTGLV